MKLIHDIEDPGSLKEVVTQDLKEIGIKFPKHKKSKTKEEILVSFLYFMYLSLLL